MKKTLIYSAMVAAGMIATQSANAALASNAVLNFDPGVTICLSSCGSYTSSVPTYGVKVGSYFGMDTDGSGVIGPSERTAVVQNAGVELGTTQAPGSIDALWSFFGSDGQDWTSSPTTVLSASGNTATADFSGWTVTWNGIPTIPMGAGAWQGNAEGVADIVCGVDCAVGDSYTLNYSGTVPANDPSGFQFVKYNLKLVGTIGAGASEVPVPAAVWLFGSGLVGLVSVARRRKAA